MASIVEQVRDGVVADFNAAGVAHFGAVLTTTVDSKWFDATDHTTTGLGVHVIGDGFRSTRLTRKSEGIEVDVIVHVNKKLDGDTIAEVDDLAELVEAFEKFYFTTAEISTVPATLRSTSVQLPTRKMLNKSRRFYAWARLTFYLVRNH